MKISIITLFPKFLEEFKSFSIIKNAIKKGLVEIKIIDLKKFSKNKNFDDYLYGGGSGMLLKIDVLVKALESIKGEKKVFALSADFSFFDQKKAAFLSKINHLVLICGHYEGFDSRIERYIDGKICLGNFITTGGEVPSMIVVESIVRLIPGVIKKDSILNESFSSDYKLEESQFTKPYDFSNLKVPEVLLSGNHKKIIE